jgi:hypothetical protein
MPTSKRPIGLTAERLAEIYGSADEALKAMKYTTVWGGKPIKHEWQEAMECCSKTIKREQGRRRKIVDELETLAFIDRTRDQHGNI